MDQLEHLISISAPLTQVDLTIIHSNNEEYKNRLRTHQLELKREFMDLMNSNNRRGN